MNKIIILLLLLIFTLNNVENKKINWFTNRLLLAYNYEFYKNHSSIITGYYPCCMAFLVGPNGTFILQDNDDFIKMWSTQYYDAGVEVTPVITSHSFQDMLMLYRNPKPFVDLAIETILKYNFTGYIFDYEDNDPNAYNYANLLNLFGKELHKYNKKLTVCVASWGYLSDYKTYSITSTDYLMSMGTYDATDTLYYTTTQLLNNVKIQKIAIGISLGLVDTWKRNILSTYLKYLQCNDVEQVDIWWTPDNANSITVPEYFINELNNFITSV